MRNNYWSCSKFADWLRGTSKPHTETSSGWNKWHKLAAAAHPTRYWLAEEGLDYVQNALHWPTDRLADIRYCINNRWISRSHALTANPRDIKPGEWCDVGNRFVLCLFNELVNFVEVEQAWHHCLWDQEAQKKYSVPWWRRGWLRLRTWRCPEAGLDYLHWASGLVVNGDWVTPDDPEYGKPTHQALAAREILDLYNWWKNVRPHRQDPHTISGWTQYCEEERQRTGDIFGGIDEDRDPEKQERIRKMLDLANQIEEQYESEDEEMMVRLIKVRRALWT